MLSTATRVITALGLACASALTAAFHLAAEPAWTIELLRYVPYPVYLAPALLVFALSWRLTWHWRCLAAGWVLVTIVGLMGLSTGSAEAGSEPLRVMTYNVKSYLADDTDKGFGPIVDEVERHRPDLLVMQDAAELNDTTAAGADRLRALVANRHVFQSGQYWVVSRYPLQDCHTQDISVRSQETNYVRCAVRTPVGDLDLITVHLLSPRRGLNATRHERFGGLDVWQLNAAQRLTQSTRIAEELARHPSDRPMILAGDLNAPEASPVVRGLLAQGLRDAFSSAAWGWGYTHGHSLRPHISFLRIDHILVSPQLSVQRCFAGGKDGSEHRPVIADLWLRPDRRPGRQ